jgi:nucleoside-diphosphate-sugar epimerase
MKILITGNMGYIGPLVVDQLRASYPDATLVGLDLGFFANCLTNSPILPECNIDIQYFHDVRNVPESMLDGVDAIVHLAAISNDPMGNTFEEVTLQVNYKAGVELAKKAKRKGCEKLCLCIELQHVRLGGRCTENRKLTAESVDGLRTVQSFHRRGIAVDSG